MDGPHLLICILLVLNGVTIETTYLDRFQLDFAAYESKVKEVILFASKVLSEKDTLVAESFNVIDNIVPSIDDMTDIVLEDRKKCNITEKYDKYRLKKSFKMDIELYSLTIREMINNLKNKVFEVETMINLYTRMAANKELSCKMLSRNCTSEVDNWAEGITKELVCRVITDCPVHNLTKRSTQNSCSGFRCKSGECINANDVCTGIVTCSDRSDEVPGCTRTCNKGFHCKNKVCIDQRKRCDEVDDCGDESDEEDCEDFVKNVCTVEYGRYECTNKNCIRLDQVCDGVDDCKDNSDEGSGCTENSCTIGRCTSAGGVCILMPNGTLCLSHCPPNMIESSTGCLPQLSAYGSTIAQILDDIPFTMQRFMAKVRHLRMAYYREINDFSDQIRMCLKRPSIVNLHIPINGTKSP